MEFVDGDLWEDRSDISRSHLQSLGRVTAQFNRALEGYDHPRLHRGHLWDITRAEQHYDKIRLIADGGTKHLVEWALQQWSRDAQPLFDHLPRQAIHGDLNLENVFVTGDEVSGLVDFTDCCFNPTICELAICLAYVMMDQQDPFAVVAAVIEGYQSVRPLSENELRILPTLVCARLAITLCVAAWRRTIDPNHPTWYVSEANAGMLLRKLARATWGANSLNSSKS
jgi:Ser/Thr protein kinase RdoA (MazF antagonist)